jgi:hypothetical protein
MEMIGLGTDRLIGWGCVDLTPLLLGTWEEVWENGSEQHEDGGGQRWRRRRRSTTVGGGGDRRRRW